MADALKAEGNKAFSAKDYSTAMYVKLSLYFKIVAGKRSLELTESSLSGKFTQAIAIEPENHVLYSNRSAVYAATSEYQKALDDANKATEIKPDWAKGWSRKGTACRGMGDLRKLFILSGHEYLNATTC
jgi:stress-induced-phosphoprotein 1